MHASLDDKALDIIFRDARTPMHWSDEPVGDDILQKLWDLVKWGPTSANCLPARIKFFKSTAAKEKLRPFVAESNIEKTISAPVCALLSYDIEFYEHLPRLFPDDQSAKTWFNWSVDHATTTAFRNGTLQSGYLIIAARALGLDAAPMSGFDNAAVDAEFFPDGKVKSNLLCGLGIRAEPTPARAPRFDFNEVCEIL